MRVKLEIPRANTGGVGYVFYSRPEKFLSPYNIVYRLKTIQNTKAYFPGVGTFEQLFDSERGNLNTNFPKIQMPGGLRGGDVEASI